MEKLKILLVDDEEKIGKDTAELLSLEKIDEIKLEVDFLQDYPKAIPKLDKNDYDIAIFDLFKGTPSETNIERFGEELLEELRKTCFVPVIFFTGLIKPVEHLKSNIIKVVRKSDGVPALKAEIKNILDSRILYIKKSLDNYIKESMRKYFWEFVQPEWDKLKYHDDVSLGYLLIRRLANSLSKEQAITLLDDPKISLNKAHPMEFYIYPPIQTEYETGDILTKENNSYVILTPSCDFVPRPKNRRKAEWTLLVKCKPLTETEESNKYNENKEDTTSKDKLKRLIESRKSDRYFFIPAAPFVANSILDFQNVIAVVYAELGTYKKVARLDDPFAQSMQSSFNRYFNRVGFPDIDSDYIIKDL